MSAASKTTPKETCFQRILAKLDADASEKVLLCWEATLLGTTNATDEASAGIIALDGKCQRGSATAQSDEQKPQPESAYSLPEGRVLGTVMVEKKSNEIPLACNYSANYKKQVVLPSSWNFGPVRSFYRHNIMSSNFDYSFNSPVREAGYLRFKFSVATQAEVTSVQPFQMQLTQNWAQPVDPGFLANLMAVENSQAFAQGLFNAVPAAQRTLTINSWMTMDVSLDTDFCFFGVTVTLPSDALQHAVGSQRVALSSNAVLRFGPSQAAWLALASRIGPPAFSQLIQRVVPPLATQTAAATQFSIWSGIALAVPIGIAVRDFCVGLCAHVRAQGVARGHWNIYGISYVRRAYGMLPRRDGHEGAKRAGVLRANIDTARWGARGVQAYLEQQFRQGRRIQPAHSQVGPFDDRAVNELGFELGEQMFRSSGGGEPERETQTPRF